MWYSRNVRTVLLLLVVGGMLSGNFSSAPGASQAAPPEPLATRYPLVLAPDQLTLIGDVTTRANSLGRCTEPWLVNTPPGSIILGVDPGSCSPADWDGGAAVAQLLLPDVYAPTVLVLKIPWPDRDGKGLHSPERNRVGSITLDGRPLWDKRTAEMSTFGDYYAVQHEPILTTIVLTGTAVHTLRFSVPPRTAWDISRIELIAYPAPSALKGIGYSPYRDCQAPGGSLQPTTRDIEEDLFRLFHTSTAIRTYAATGANRQIPALANAVGLPVYAGAWLDKNASDEAEIQALIELANTTKLAGAIVGNEYYLRHRSDADLDDLRRRIEQVRAGLNDKRLPLMTAELDGLMFDWKGNSSTEITGTKPAYKPILDRVDVVLVHIYPFWNGQPIEGAAAFTINRYNAIRSYIAKEYPGQNKRVIIGETGWPSGGKPNREAVPSMEHQRRYMLEFLLLAERHQVDFLYFDTFDELWKIEEPGRVGQNWGYSYSERTVKHYFNGVMIPTEQLLFRKIYLALIINAQPSPVPIPFPSASRAPGMAAADPAQAPDGDAFPVYTEWLADPGRFVPVGWMGDIANLSLFECDRTNPHSGEMAIRATFSPTGTLGWGGISWQDPASDWGKQPGGYDLSGARRLSFWARGAQGGEVVEFMVGGLGAAADRYRDTLQPARTSFPIVLSDRWEQITIDLTDADLRRVVGGFTMVASRCHNREPITFYLDDMVFDFDDTPLPAPAPRRQFYVYDDLHSGCTHFAPSGFMGDIEDLSLDPAWTDAPARGATAIRVSYTAQGSRGAGWAGLYWQEPENNWGTIDGGFDLRWANKLTFRAKGARGGEQVQFFVGGIGDHTAPYPDSLRPALTTGSIPLSTSWQTYTIDLRGRNLSRVIGGFGLTATPCGQAGGATFYLDDIVFTFDPDMPPAPPGGHSFPVYTDAGAPDNHYVPSLWMGDAAVPGRVSLTECWTDDRYSGGSSIRVAYTQQVLGWAGMYWVHPAENVGQLPGGFDLTGAARLTFWARSDTPSAPVTFLIGGVGYHTDAQGRTICELPAQLFPDSVCPPFRQTIVLSPTWTKYTIDLRQLPQRILNNVVGGFGWVAPTPLVFYLDDIVYEFD